MITAEEFWEKVGAAFRDHYNKQFISGTDQPENVSDFLSTLDVLADEWFNRSNKVTKK